jgi:hypothetical protein
MKFSSSASIMKSILNSIWRFPYTESLRACILIVAVPLIVRAADEPRTFATPEEAVATLGSATKAEDGAALRSIFGSGLVDVQNPDRVQATNEFATFAAALGETNYLNRKSPTNYVLVVGTQQWPFPIPIVKKANGWIFDTDAGKEELENRRVGRNELSTLETIRAYVQAQREYAEKDRDGDGVLEYAQRFSSSPGKKDGLYWPSDLDGEASPLGPLVAEAQEKGYAARTDEEVGPPRPFQGYYFKILHRQGKHAAGGKYDYIINGNMIGGFAMVAWPAGYGDSGVMTFIVNQQGRVYQKDLGEKTDKLARKMKEFDPDPSWQLSPD